jgi:PAS domain-containing protein
MNDMSESEARGPGREVRLRYHDGSERLVFAREEEVQFPEGRLIVSRTDKGGVITQVNDSFCEVAGYSREELLRRSRTAFSGTPTCRRGLPHALGNRRPRRDLARLRQEPVQGRPLLLGLRDGDPQQAARRNRRLYLGASEPSRARVAKRKNSTRPWLEFAPLTRATEEHAFPIHGQSRLQSPPRARLVRLQHLAAASARGALSSSYTPASKLSVKRSAATAST